MRKAAAKGWTCVAITLRFRFVTKVRTKSVRYYAPHPAGVVLPPVAACFTVAFPVWCRHPAIGQFPPNRANERHGVSDGPEGCNIAHGQSAVAPDEYRTIIRHGLSGTMSAYKCQRVPKGINRPGYAYLAPGRTAAALNGHRAINRMPTGL